jgi:phosphoribosylpyrophosphate synthetase
MRSSALQLRNVLQAFEAAEAPDLASAAAQAPTAGLAHTSQRFARQVASTAGSAVSLPPVPVLLVDDMVDSGWTLTLAAVLLQHHGSGPVHPFALAKASPRGS